MTLDLFLKNKILRQLRMNGITCTFFRYSEDEYKQKNQEPKEVLEAKCLFHTTNTYLSSKVSDATQTSSKKKPMLLMLYEDAAVLEKEDFVIINDQKMIVVDKTNVQQLNVAFEISLEVFNE